MIPRKMALALAVFLLVIAFGTLGFEILEDWTFVDALYHSVITLYSVGYDEDPTRPELSIATKIFTVVLIILGYSAIAFLALTLGSFLVEGSIDSYFRRTKMTREIQKLTDHYIVCGCGQTGRSVMEEFLHAGLPFVGIDVHPASLETARRLGDVLTLLGDATKDEVLLEAEIRDARGLIAALDSDVDNLYIVLTARDINPDLTIIARASEESAERKLYKAGASNVISPNQIGGKRMASLVMRPEVVSFLDVMIHDRDQVLRLEQVKIPKGSELAGKALKDLALPKRFGLNVVAVHKGTGEPYQLNPGSETVIDGDDVLICLGNPEQTVALREYLAG